MSRHLDRNYQEVIKLKTFEERFNYLKLDLSTPRWGIDRRINQAFYRSPIWNRIRDYIIYRDKGDLGLEDRIIYGRLLIHHLNPVEPKDFFLNSSGLYKSSLVDPNNLILCSQDTHNGIHLGALFIENEERRPNDTVPWKLP